MHYRQLGHSGLLVSEIILATKGRCPVDKNPNNAGSSRYHLIRACEASLNRLDPSRA
ncbi:hypothetical protein ACI77M_05435 [Pseudomonas fildesensis]|uniref:hypothetical protein n=1 Tax=Pseudomonas fildesensis TaxID=1674920 RepID=UPI00387AB3E8